MQLRTDSFHKRHAHKDVSSPSYAYLIIFLFAIYALAWLFLIPPERVKDSHTSLDRTVVMDKYSCVRGMYPFHIACAWVAFLGGLFAMIFRVLSYISDFDFYNELHMWAGRAYILGLLWTAATSTVIRNEGLPLGTLVAFLWVLGCLTFGWVLIRLDHSAPVSRIVHGAFMFTSWISIAGRITNYSFSKEFTCYTYPAYKAVGSVKNATLLPGSDPHYESLMWANKEVWGWGLPLLMGPFLGTLLLAWCVQRSFIE